MILHHVFGRRREGQWVQDLVDKDAESIYGALVLLAFAALALVCFANPTLPIGTSTSLATVYAMFHGHGFGGDSKILSLESVQRRAAPSW